MIIAKSLVSFIALLHIYFLILEMFFWTKPLGLKTFRQTEQKAKDSEALAANMGLYNGFMAAGLIWSLVHPDGVLGPQIALFFLSCIVLAGIYGGYSVGKKIFFIQSIPALVAIVFLFI